MTPLPMLMSLLIPTQPKTQGLPRRERVVGHTTEDVSISTPLALQAGSLNLQVVMELVRRP